MLQIGTAGRQGSGTHSDEDHISLGDRLDVSCGEADPVSHLVQHLAEPGLIDRNVPRAQAFDLDLVHIYAGHVMTQVSQS